MDNKIKEIRKHKGLTQQELANLLGISASAVSQFESSDITKLSMDTLRKLSDALDVDIYELQGASFIRKAIDKDNQDKEKKLLSYFKKLNPMGKGLAIDIVRSLSARESLQDTQKKKK